MGALWLAALLALWPQANAYAGSQFCGRDPELDAPQQLRQLRLSALLRTELERSGHAVALVARDGTDLSRWRIRYSHAGLIFRHHPEGPWTVRQLYYDCEQGQPRLFDQGLTGFVNGSRRLERGFLSFVLLPDEAAQPLANTALDPGQAMALLHPRYSANAHAFSTTFQNCNQWVVELMALAWGGAQNREQAQIWLREQAYAAQSVEVGRAWLWLSRLSPWLHLRDHPEPDVAQARLRISLPEAMMDWLQQRHARAQRLQVCHAGDRVVLRRGAAPLSEGCEPEPGDEVHSLAG